MALRPSVVAPLPGAASTAAGRYLAKHGAGGYMVLLQVPDLASVEALNGEENGQQGKV